jgi:membrane-associated phospholipid phosphatase
MGELTGRRAAAYREAVESRRRSRPAHLVAFGLAAPLAVFGSLAAAVVLRGHVPGENDVAEVARSAIWSIWVPFDGTRLLESSTIGGPLLLIAFAVVLVRSAGRSYAAFWVAAVGSVFLLDPLLKAAFQRPSIAGPDGEYSFPSGTALFCAAAVAAIALTMPRGRGSVAVAVAGGLVCLAFGAAIVAADWHYPSDVVAGWALGVAWTSGLWLAFSAVRRRPLGTSNEARPRPKLSGPSS